MWFKKRGLVTSIKDGHCIVVNPDGGYEKIPLPSREVQVGEEVFYNRVRIPAEIKSVLVAASFLLFFLTSVLLYQGSVNRVAAYITMDINPSLEISVDSKSLVIDVTCLNEEATRLVKPGEYKGKSLDYTIAAIIDKSVEQKFLKPGEENLIVTTISPVDDKAEPVDGKALGRLVEQSATARECPVQVRVYTASGEIRKKAKNTGISSGRYLIYKEMKKQDPSVKIDDVKKDSIKKLLEEHNVELPPNYKRYTREKDKAGRNKNVGFEKTSGSNSSKKNDKGRKSTSGNKNDNDRKNTSGDKNKNNKDKNDNSKKNGKKPTNSSNKGNTWSKQSKNTAEEREILKFMRGNNHSFNYWQNSFVTTRFSNRFD